MDSVPSGPRVRAFVLSFFRSSSSCDSNSDKLYTHISVFRAIRPPTLDLLGTHSSVVSLFPVLILILILNLILITYPLTSQVLCAIHLPTLDLHTRNEFGKGTVGVPVLMHGD
jgi:hypothetical protein